jgi:hypothetical protein
MMYDVNSVWGGACRRVDGRGSSNLDLFTLFAVRALCPCAPALRPRPRPSLMLTLAMRLGGLPFSCDLEWCRAQAVSLVEDPRSTRGSLFAQQSPGAQSGTSNQHKHGIDVLFAYEASVHCIAYVVRGVAPH